MNKVKNLGIIVIFFVVSSFISFEAFDRLFELDKKYAEYFFTFTFSLSLLWNVYLYKYFEWSATRYKKYDAKIYNSKILKIPYIKYNNVKVLAQSADSVSVDGWFVGNLMMFCITYFISLFFYGDWLFVFFSLLCIGFGSIGLIVHIKDVYNFKEIIKKRKLYLYAEFKDEDIIFREDSEISYKYSNIMFYRVVYNEMDLETLKNEFILVSQKIENDGIFKFIEKCAMPVILFVAGGVLSIFSTMLAYQVNSVVESNVANEINLIDEILIGYILIIISFGVLLFFSFAFVYFIFKPDKKTLTMQKMIIEELINENNDNRNN